MLPFARVEHGPPCGNEYCRLCRSKTIHPAQRCQHGSMTEPFENICQTGPGVPDHRFHASAGSAAIHLAADPASRRNLALFDSMEHFVHEMLCDTAPDAHDVSIHSRPIRRLTEAADGEGSCGLPLPERRSYRKGFHRLRRRVSRSFPPEGGTFRPQRNF